MPGSRLHFSVRREVVLAVLAIVSIVIGISRLQNPLPPPLWVQLLDVAIAAAFATDWALRIGSAERPWKYTLTHLYEIVFFVPFTVLPPDTSGASLVRGARLIRTLRWVRYGRFLRLSLALSRLPRRVRHLQRVADNAQLVAIFVTGLVTVSLGGAALMLTERTAAGLRSYPEAFWWSLSLFTTVAYDVPDPQTDVGRIVCGALMVAGVVYVGVFTASLASAILRTPADREDEGEEGGGPPASGPGSKQREQDHARGIKEEHEEALEPDPRRSVTFPAQQAQ